MHRSNSIALLGPKIPRTEAVIEVNSQHRSSLDTFVIPGRTRLPSSRTSRSSLSNQDATNIQIAHNLLHYRDMASSRGPSNTTLPQRSDSLEYTKVRQDLHTCEVHNGPVRHQETSRYSEREVRDQSMSGHRDQDALSVRGHHEELMHSQSQQPVANTNQVAFQDQTDGPSDAGVFSNVADSDHFSRATNMASGSSPEMRVLRAPTCKHSYNNFANRYGFPLLTGGGEITDGNAGTSQMEESEKSHNIRIPKRLNPSSSMSKLRTQMSKTSVGRFIYKSSNSPEHVLNGRTLEEMSVLGGVNALSLPSAFAAGELKTVTVVAVCGDYIIRTGLYATGIFRVPGSTATVDKLYNHFDRAFSSAGSPSKVKETVSVGILPERIPFTLEDVASLFKKIIHDLPGGLLGSLEIFEVLRSVLCNEGEGSARSKSEIENVRAKVVALAISGITSPDRQILIEGVIGLVAYLGFEGDRARDEDGINKSNIMSSPALSTVFGPLLLGDMVDGIRINEDLSDYIAANNEQHHSFQVPKQRNIAADSSKLAGSGALIAQCKRLDISIRVTLALLRIWPHTVRHLREINGSLKVEPNTVRGVVKKKGVNLANGHTTNPVHRQEQEQGDLSNDGGDVALPTGQNGSDQEVNTASPVVTSAQIPWNEDVPRLEKDYSGHESRDETPLTAIKTRERPVKERETKLRARTIGAQTAESSASVDDIAAPASLHEQSLAYRQSPVVHNSPALPEPQEWSAMAASPRKMQTPKRSSRRTERQTALVPLQLASSVGSQSPSSEESSRNREHYWKERALKAEHQVAVYRRAFMGLGEIVDDTRAQLDNNGPEIFNGE